MKKSELNRYYVEKWLDDKWNYDSVTSAYAKPSGRKVAIENSIKDQMRYLNGKRYRVISHNCFHFSCAYAWKKDDKWMLTVEAPSKHTEIELIDEDVRRAYL